VAGGRRGLALALLVFFAAEADAQSPSVVRLAEGVEIHERGGNAWRKYGVPAASLVVHQGEIRDLRDVQGWHRMDVGAGNAEEPGTLAFGADVTRRIVFHVRRPGEPPRKMLEITPRGIVFYQRPVVRAP
jgi:hypothetical protein